MGGAVADQSKTYREIISRIENERDLPARQISLDRTRAALDSLDLAFPDRGAGVMLVGGTNGKGTVAKTLEVLLDVKSPRVGLFTSPHLMDTTERIRSHGKDLTPEEFVEVFRSVESAVTRFGLSHFETLTVMMAETFFGGRVRKPVERAVIEIGVGGRLDPTRLIPHDTTVITRLGMDHQALLGPTLALIAREKFGAVDSSNLVVHAPFPDEVRPVAEEVMLSCGGRWVESATFPFAVFDFDPPRWCLKTPWGIAVLALPGERAAENVSLALTVLREQGEAIEFLLPFVAACHWPGRMEEFFLNGRRVYLSGDHNVQGVESLGEILRHFRYDRLHVVAGVGKNKDASGMLGGFASLPRSSLILTETPFRPSGKSAYGDWIGRADAYEEDPVRALGQTLQRSKEKDLILVSGSLYMIGHLRKEIVVNRAFGDWKPSR
jgi:dihydrofolate synthase / folylpolyglutamate synthase